MRDTKRHVGAALIVLALGGGAVPACAGTAEDPPASGTAVPSAPVTAPAVIPTVQDDASFFAPADDLERYAPGAPLKVRQQPYIPENIEGFSSPVEVTQVQYRTTDTLGEPSVAATSVIHPPSGVEPSGNTVMYASFYDSMRPEDGPSRVLSGSVTEGGAVVLAELAFIAPLLGAGHTVVMPDIQGERGIFAAGPEYGQIILDGLRASHRTPAAAVPSDAPAALVGYSGGSIGAGWAAILAESYAPDVAESIVGVAQGGTMVRPEHNLVYAGEGSGWSGVVGMAMVGLARAYGVDLDPYLTANGRQVFADMDRVAIGDASDSYDHLRWGEMILPEYPDPDSIPEVRHLLDDTNMGLRPTPPFPQLLVQAGGGEAENTPPHPVLGDGDGVMLLGDTRALARQYCGDGTDVDYREIPTGGHTVGGAAWAAQMVPWVNDRFAGDEPTTSCGQIPEGNPLS
ncbi:lipase family protein [Corynebacterium sp.]|uniref:lipase family protein n=1 Tax=Corynebacterium sp. TaxID=1720 RepID=UPI003B3A981D